MGNGGQQWAMADNNGADPSSFWSPEGLSCIHGNRSHSDLTLTHIQERVCCTIVLRFASPNKVVHSRLRALEHRPGTEVYLRSAVVQRTTGPFAVAEYPPKLPLKQPVENPGVFSFPNVSPFPFVTAHLAWYRRTRYVIEDPPWPGPVAAGPCQYRALHSPAK
ncbi:uncharacterized protein SPSK_09914 [Sporothrix schenckii 1099-18]|uniref:Uncharacterized protein n=1 Tax=Sporothrix schenckii 1099-18 TaxID=1397361 RepID=A0A0F2M7I3_SPOSC|nr:uncharacterized protein SPSK_09914 [Sporothrix schenckii 1099-18]KJR85597.1 hypothetical protein SPSK_09914 [Sporothrix schenckii 1099-18]